MTIKTTGTIIVIGCNVPADTIIVPTRIYPVDTFIWTKRKYRVTYKIINLFFFFFKLYFLSKNNYCVNNNRTGRKLKKLF